MREKRPRYHVDRLRPEDPDGTVIEWVLSTAIHRVYASSLCISINNLANTKIDQSHLQLYIPPSFLLAKLLALGLPKHPSKSDTQLQERRNPKRASKSNPRLAQETTTNSSNKQQQGSSSPPVSIRIVRDRRREELGVTHHVTVQTRQYNGGNRVELERATCHNLAGTLERENRNSCVVGSREGIAHALDDVSVFADRFASLGMVPNCAYCSEQCDKAGEESLDEEG